MQQIPSSGPLMRPPVPMMPQQASSFQITPKEIVSIFLRHFLLIVICTVAGTIIGGASWFLLLRYKPLYTATTAINVLPPGQSDPLTIEERLPAKDLYYQFRATKAAYLKQQNFLQELLRLDAVRDTNWYRGFKNDTTRAFEKLEDNLSASAQREGNWIIVSFTCGSKKESAKIVNEAVNLYITKQREMATSDLRAQLAERTRQQQSLLAEQRGIDDTLSNIRTASQFSDFSREGSFRSYLSAKLEEAEIRYNQLDSSMANIRQLVETLRRRAEGDFDPVLRERMERDPIASNMRQNIAALEINLAQLLARFGENHRRVIEAKRSLEKAKFDLADRQAQIAEIERQSDLLNAQDQMTILMAQLEQLENQRSEARTEYKRLDNIRAEYEKSQIARDDIQTRLEQVNLNIQKLRMLVENPDIANVQKIGDAPEPLQPSFPKMIVFIPAGFILGGMLGVGLAFLIEFLNETIRTPKDVSSVLRAPMVGMIFHESEDDYLNERIDPRLVVHQAPYSIMSECYRQLKTNLKLFGSEESRKVIFITSCGGGAGKTSVVSNLAATYVAEGKKTLIIDANFRRPALTELFPITREDGSVSEHADKGLSNLLLGQCEYTAVIRPTGMPGLDIIDSGPIPQNPAALVGNGLMMQLLARVHQEYDYVIVDGPPMIVSDAKTIASEVDGVLVVLNAGTTKRGEAQRILRELREVNANVLGTVLLGVKTLRGGYFQEIFKSYHAYHPAQLPQTPTAV